MKKKLDDYVSLESIRKRAIENWDNKTVDEKRKKSERYKHVSEIYGYYGLKWNKSFLELNDFQQMVVMKAEIIRTYDMLNVYYRKVFNEYLGLEENAKKWHLLSFKSKNKIMEHYGFKGVIKKQ